MPSIDWNKSDWIIQPRHGPCGLGNKIIFGSMYLHKIDGPTEHFLTLRLTRLLYQITCVKYPRKTNTLQTCNKNIIYDCHIGCH